mgnify:CR=1 FL=1
MARRRSPAGFHSVAFSESSSASVAAALAALCDALERTEIAGSVVNTGFLAALAQDSDFAAGDVDTGLIARNQGVLTALPQPSRLILRAIGGLTRKPALSCTIEGVNGDGQPAHEEIPAARFAWYRNTGVATSTTVWRELRYLKFDGLSRVYTVQVSTVDLSRHDQSLFVPLWTDAVTPEQVEQMVAMLTDPARYGREYGIPACPANDPAYDPTQQNGCGAVWPPARSARCSSRSRCWAGKSWNWRWSATPKTRRSPSVTSRTSMPWASTPVIPTAPPRC